MSMTPEARYEELRKAIQELKEALLRDDYNIFDDDNIFMCKCCGFVLDY